MTMAGFVHTNLLKQLDVAEEQYDLALRINPNDGLAWLLKGTLHAFKGEGAIAVEHTERSLKLSPLDPHRYFYARLRQRLRYPPGSTSGPSSSPRSRCAPTAPIPRPSARWRSRNGSSACMTRRGAQSAS